MPKHFLHLSDYSSGELWEILHLAKEIKTKFHNKEVYKPFEGRSLAMIFAKPSARTRVSFETGFEWMGGHALFLGPNDIGIGKREAIKDISRVFSRYNDMVMARLFDHKHITSSFIFARLLNDPNVIYLFLLAGNSLIFISKSGAVKEIHIFGKWKIFSVKYFLSLKGVT